ncbi:MAG: hypothetical protein WA369_07775 [Candidatus Acidiferrales bacterium]
MRTAIGKLNRVGCVSAKSWEECNVGGKIVIQEICREIAAADIFCADLTGMNANVMFELGYAIAMNRRIWLGLDATLVDSKTHFEQLRVLTTVGYARYCNSQELAAAFLTDKPYEELQNTVFENSIRPSLGPTVGEKILYLKSRHDTEASIRISNLVDDLRAADIQIIVDDPKESTVQSLTWYGVQVYSSEGVICHLTGPDRTGARLLNARHALVSGMAYGMEKNLLMLAEGNFLAPIDYRDLLHHYVTAAEAERHVGGWLNELEKRRYGRKIAEHSFASSVKLATELRGLQIGEYIAENEAEPLVDRYFVETAAYNQALQPGYAIFVGRKGVGKSANLLKLVSEIGKDKRNLVCVIKPVAYDLEGIVSLLGKYKERDAKGYAVESLWKFLLYAEMAHAAAAALRKQSPGSLKSDENELLRLVDEKEGPLRGDFTTRLQRCAEAMLSSHADEGSPEQFRPAISEALHQGVLRDLRILLGRILAGKTRVAILIDNLDKAWDKQSDFHSLTDFLLGLLSASARLPDEFKREDSYRQPVPLSLAVFLRSDIFYKLLAAAREPDKIVHSKIHWRDQELLLRVIDERFVSSHEGTAQPAELWAKYFSPTVNGAPTREYFYSRTLPRPRDLVFFVKSAISTAVNRGQPIVRESDVLEAEKQYSQYALESILVENGISVGNLETILYEFAGCSSRLSEAEVLARLAKAGVRTEDYSRIVDHLSSLAFLGLQVRPGDYRFAEDPPEQKRNLALARSSLRPGESLAFTIHPAFWTFLEVSPA